VSDLKCLRVDGYYTIGNQRFASITTIIGKMIPKDQYLDKWKAKNWNWRELRDNAALVGSIMHQRILQDYSEAMIELPNLKGVLDWPPGIEEELEARDKSWERLGLDIKEAYVEKTVVIREPGSEAAGTADMIGTIEGFRSILDLKSSSRIYDSQRIQIAAYALGAEAEGEKIERGFIVALRGDNCEIDEIEADELVEYKARFLDLARRFNAMK